MILSHHLSIEFADRLAALSPAQREDLEETLLYMPERELELLCADLRRRNADRLEPSLVGAP